MIENNPFPFTFASGEIFLPPVSYTSCPILPMLTVNDTLHGWSPADDNDDIEVNVSQNCFVAINPTTSSLSPICPPLDAIPKTRPPLSQSTSLAPLISVTRTAIAPSSDRRAQRNRNRDPSWIPRPRNAFIIFRCEYSRQHAQGSGESQDDHDADSAKSLSKRAAEAWRNLPPSERARYKVLADMEREEHARLHPNYRFRPVKRQVSGTRRSPCERSKSPKASSVERRPAALRVEISTAAPEASTAPLREPSPRPNDQHAARTDSQVLLGVDVNDHMLFYPPSEATSPIDLFSSLYTSEVNNPLDTFHDSSYGLHSTHDDLERAQALEAYAIGLYNHDLFSPFLFPEHY